MTNRTGSTSAVSWSRLGTGPVRRGRSDPRRAGSRPRRPRDGPWRILLRGIGYEHNDVSVVTNVSADHLGLHGIDTLDELAEVKGAVVRITRRDGWAVLNGEDPRVWACGSTAGPDRTRSASRPGHQPWPRRWPRVGGHRSSSAADSCSRPRGRRVRVVAVDDLPVTFAGLSRYNVANALAAAAACDALGLSTDEIRDGLLSFAPDAEVNPAGSTCTRGAGCSRWSTSHNEAGLAGLLDVCDRLVARRGAGFGWGSERPATAPTRSSIGWACWPGAESTTSSSPRSRITCAGEPWRQ